MKKNAIFLALIFQFSFLTSTWAQIQYEEGTTWHYGFVSHGLLPIVTYTSQSLAIDGDTILNGEPFQRIVKSNGSQNWDIQTPFSVEYIRREENKVLRLNQQNGVVSILYDFGAEPGESWTISIHDCELLVVVDSVSYSDYNGVIKKNIYVNDYFIGFEDREYVGYCFKGKIVEDIGHTVTFFPHRAFYLCYGLEVDGVSPDGIRCYEDSSFNYNFKNYPCNSTWTEWVGINDYEQTNIKIFPNPVKDHLAIETSDETDIIITDIIGKVIVEKRNIISKIYLDTSKWEIGIYFISVYSKGIRIKTEKLIKF